MVFSFEALVGFCPDHLANRWQRFRKTMTDLEWTRSTSARKIVDAACAIGSVAVNRVVLSADRRGCFCPGPRGQVSFHQKT